MTFNPKKYFNPNKLVLGWVIIATIFGSFAALSNSQFLNSGRDVFAAKNCPGGRSVFKDGKETCEIAFCEEGEVTKLDNYVCTNANKEERIELLCNDNQKPKAGSECNFTQTGLAPVYGGEGCPAGFTEIYNSVRNQGLPLYGENNIFGFNFTTQKGISNAYRQGKLCSTRPDFFSIQPGCPEPNPNILPGGVAFDPKKNSEFAEAFYNQKDTSTQRAACFEDCPAGFSRVVVEKVLKNFCRQGNAECDSVGFFGGSFQNASCNGKEYCNANFSGLCKIIGKRERPTVFGIGASSYDIDLLTEQKIRGTRSVCGLGKKPFLSWTGSGHSSYSNNTLCVKNEYLSQVSYIAGSTLNSTTPKQCTSLNQIEVFFDDADISDTEMDLLCTPRTFPPQFEKKTFVCPSGWSEFNTEKCQKPAQFKTLDESSLDVLFYNSCNKTSLRSGESTICTSRFNDFLTGKIVFSNDKNDERCEIIVSDGNSGSGTCELKLTNKSPTGNYYTIEDFQIKAEFDTVELIKPVGKIKVYPQECAENETNAGQVCQATLANQARYNTPSIEYDGSFPSASTPSYFPTSTSSTSSSNESIGVPDVVLFDTNGDGKIDSKDIQPTVDTNGDGKIDLKDLFDTNGDGVIDYRDIQPTVDTNGDGKIDLKDLFDNNKGDGKIDNKDIQPDKDTNGDGKVDVKDLFDTNGDGKIDSKDIQPTVDTNGDGKIDLKDLFDTNGDGVIDNRDVQPKNDTNSDGKIDLKDLFDTNGDGKIDNKDTQPDKDTNSDGKFDVKDLLDTNGDGVIDSRDIQPVIDTNGDGKIDLKDLFDTNGNGKIDSEDIQPKNNTNGDGKIDLKDLLDNNYGDGKIDSRDIQPVIDTNGDGKIDLKDLLDTNGDGVIDSRDVQPGSDNKDLAKNEYLDKINFSSDLNKIASPKEISDAIKCRGEEKDKTIIICEGQLPQGKTANDLKIKIGDEEISCNVSSVGKIACTPTKIKELIDNPDQDLAFSVKTSDSPDFILTKLINFAKGTTISCEDSFDQCFANEVTLEELAQAIKCKKDASDPTIVICEGQLPPGKTAEDIKIKIGDNSIVSCNIDETGKIRCAPIRVKELIDNPNQDLSFSILNKFYSRLKEVKKYNFFTGKETFCSVKDVKCLNQGATKVSLAQSNFVDSTCSGIDNKCLSGTGDFGSAKGYQKNSFNSVIANNTLFISLILFGLLAIGVGVYVYFRYFKKDNSEL
jgi:EF hand